MRVTYHFQMTHFDGSRDSNSCGPVEFEQTHAAWFSALRTALLSGWTPPKWWQWWRWDDQPRSLAIPPEVRTSYFGQRQPLPTAPREGG